MNFDIKITDFFKLPTKIMISIVIASGMILFLPEHILQKMYMVDFRMRYGFVIGITFLVSSSIVIVAVIVGIYNYYKNKMFWKKFKETSKDRLQGLDDYKKTIIYTLYMKDNHTEELPLHDGAVNDLKHKMVIIEATTQYMTGDLNNAVFPYTLQPWVVETLNKHRDLLDDYIQSFNIVSDKYR